MTKYKNYKQFIVFCLLLLLTIGIGLSLIIILKDCGNEYKNLGEKYKNLTQKVELLQKDIQIQQSMYETELDNLKSNITFLTYPHLFINSRNNRQNEEITTVIIDKDKTEALEITYSTDYGDYEVNFEIGEEVPLPEDIDTNTFRCMDYRTITDINSPQYRLQKSAKTERSTGLRYYTHNGKNYYTVALATAYGIELGGIYEVTLANGTIFNIIHSEYKHDISNPSHDDFGDFDINYDGESAMSVIEFIYDWSIAPRALIQDGEANRWLGENCDIYGDGCNIVSMVYLGNVLE